jgi:hypothetical protein
LQFTDGIYNSENFIPALWYGSVDQLAFYSTNLSETKITEHAYKYFNGSNDAPATVTMLTSSKSMFAGASQKFEVLAGGEPPWTYVWRTNGIIVTGASTPRLTLANITATVSVTCTVQGSTGGPAVSSPCVITITTPTVGSYASQVMSNSPVAFYRFNETSGNTAFDWAGTHDGVYQGAVTKNVAGPAAGEGGVQVYGTNMPDGTLSRVKVTYAPQLNACGPLNTNGAFTYEYWFKPSIQQIGFVQSILSAHFRLGNNRAGIQEIYDNAKAFGNASFGEYWGRSGRYNNINQATSWGVNTAAFESIQLWHHVVHTFTPNGTGSPTAGLNGTQTFYIDGNQVQTGSSQFFPYTISGSQWQPNYFGDLNIGNAALNEPSVITGPANGVIGAVAIYTNALTASQVQAHYAAYYTAATNVSNPTAAVTNESFNNSVTLTAIISGNGNSYVWYKDGVALTNSFINTVTLDGTAKYPAIFNGVFFLQGVQAPVLVINQVSPADNGFYKLRVYNQLNTPLGYIETTPVSVTVSPDTTKPVAVGAGALGQVLIGAPALTQVELKFIKRMDFATVTNPANYTVSGGVTVTNVYIARTPNETKFLGDTRTVTLQTTPLTPGQNYSVAISSSVKDQTFTGNTILPTTVYFTAPIAKQGISWSLYPLISGGMSQLTSGQYNNSALSMGTAPSWVQGTNSFPFVPQYETTLTNLDTVDLNAGSGSGPSGSIGANLLFGTGAIGSGYGANYGAILSGWITPTNTDSYSFFMKADDNAAFYLSTDGSPDNATMIAIATGVVGNYIEYPGFDSATSLPVGLTAGQPYYFQLVLYQASANDYASIAWRSASGPDNATPAASLTPIASEFLTSWGRPPQAVLTATVSGGNVTVSWTGLGRLMESSDITLPVSQWTPVAGNPSSPYVTPAAAGQKFYRIVQ